MSGFDIKAKDDTLFADIKNKHNTMNSSSSQKTYMRMMDTLLKTPSATCLLVEIIATNSQNNIWKMSLDGIPFSNNSIRRVSIDKFYEMVTRDKLAFKKLCEKLPVIIEDIVNDGAFDPGTNSVVKELKDIDPNLIKSLYLSSFKKYEGFDTFNL